LKDVEKIFILANVNKHIGHIQELQEVLNG